MPVDYQFLQNISQSFQEFCDDNSVCAAWDMEPNNANYASIEYQVVYAKKYLPAYYVEYCEMAEMLDRHVQGRGLNHLNIASFGCGLCQDYFALSANLQIPFTYVGYDAQPWEAMEFMPPRGENFGDYIHDKAASMVVVSNHKETATMADINRPIFTDADKAREYLEAIRWPEGPSCPHCGSVEGIKKMEGKAHRPGLYQCNACREQFTVTVGTVYERSKIPLNKWLLATYLLSASKKGMSAHQLHRMLGVTYKTAWFMCHRIREGMTEDGITGPMGGNGGAVEVDETFIGRDKSIKPDHEKKGRGYAHKHKVLALVDRSTGRAKAMVVDSLKAKDITPILRENIAAEARVMTDEAGQYYHLSRDFAEHGVVRHGIDEYVSAEDPTIYTNTVEGYFSIFKRGMKGVYQHCAKKHLHRYVAEFNFRYNERKADDMERAVIALKGIEGKRLTYRRIGVGAHV